MELKTSMSCSSAKTGKEEIAELLAVVAKLRSPEDGCPWDRKQTHKSLKKYLLEETYEVMQAIDDENYQSLREELGDLLFQVCLHAQIASENGNFDFATLVHSIKEKMVRRHPHVFGSTHYRPSDSELHSQWESIKEAEKSLLVTQNGSMEKATDSPFASIPRELPSLARAIKVLKKASKLQLNIPIDKMQDELVKIQDSEALGLYLLSIAENCRHKGLDPEEALRLATAKMQKEFESSTNNGK